MKIIHCADLHIDSKMETNIGSEKAKIRKRELVSTFENMVNYANEQGVKAIIIAGDMFDTASVTKKSREQIFNIIKTNSNIDFLYLAGNHDEENIISSLVENLENLKVFGKTWTEFLYGNIVITGIELNGNNGNVYETLELEKDKFNIVVLHGQIAKYNSSKDYAEVINLPKLKGKNIDYLALGHIHSYAQDKLDDRGIYCYSGCIEGRGFDECGEKGFVLLNIQEDNFTQKFIPFAKRRLHLLECDITSIDNWFDIERKVLENIININQTDMVKVVLTGKYKLSLLKQIEHLNERLNQIFFFAKVKDESQLEINIKDFENDPTLKGEFIRNVLSANELTQSEKEKIILIGLNAINGEEI